MIFWFLNAWRNRVSHRKLHFVWWVRLWSHHTVNPFDIVYSGNTWCFYYDTNRRKTPSCHLRGLFTMNEKITPVCNPDNRKNSALPFSIQHQLTAKTVPHAEVFSYIMPAFFLFCGFLHHIVIKEFPYHIAGSAHMKAAGHNNDVLPCMCIT